MRRSIRERRFVDDATGESRGNSATKKRSRESGRLSEIVLHANNNIPSVRNTTTVQRICLARYFSLRLESSF